VRVFQTLREKLRCKEIWVTGAGRWRNPDDDLPKDFEANRAENYQALRKPLDPATFIGELREEMETELAALHEALPALDWLQIKERKNGGAIILTPLEAAPEPRNLRRLKAAVKARWGTVPLLDMLTETALRTGCLNAFTPAGTRSDIDPAVLFQRLLLLLIYAYGTNAGIAAVAAGEHGHTEDDLRYARRRFFTVEACREAARAIANATFASRQAWLWGQGTTAVASDSTHFTAFDQNIFTEWHSRYKRGKRGVLIYWTVETSGSMAVHSQVLSCSASEVHTMVEGAMRHGTDMSIEQNYVDSHGVVVTWTPLVPLALLVPGCDQLYGDRAAAGLRPARPVQADQHDETVRSRCREPGRLSAAAARHGPAAAVGPHRPAVRPDGQVRHRDPARHRLHRGDPAALHQERHPSRLRRDAGDRPGTKDDLPRPLPA